jgi:hypothetical protein
MFPTFNKPVNFAAELRAPKWSVKDSAIGDLNGDGRPDMAVVLEYADTVTEIRGDSIENTGKPRILLVLLHDANDQGYHVALQNNTFILREGEGGMVSDPYGDISIKNGIFEIEYQYVRSSLTYKFRIGAAGICLIGATDAGVESNKFEEWDVNFSTGKAKHTWQNMPEGQDHLEWKQMKPRAPIKLMDMKFAWELEIFPDVFI